MNNIAPVVNYENCILGIENLGSNVDIYDVLPKQFKEDNSTLEKIEVNTTFKRLSGLLTSMPSLTFHNLLNLEPYKKCLEEKKIFTYENINQIPYRVNFEDTIKFEIKNTIYRCFNNKDPKLKQYIPYNNNNTFLDKSILAFYNSDSNIYVGFIKLYSKLPFVELTKRFLNVTGHINCFIIDKSNNQLIFYEPKGRLQLFSMWCSANVIDYLKKSIVNEEVKNWIDKLKVIDTSKMMGVTPQWGDIYCQTYGIYAALLYCMNPTNNLEKLKQLFRLVTLDKAKLFQKYFLTNFLPEISKSIPSEEPYPIKHMNNFGEEPVYMQGSANNNGFVKLGGGTKKYLMKRKITKTKTKKYKNNYKNKKHTIKNKKY